LGEDNGSNAIVENAEMNPVLTGTKKPLSTPDAHQLSTKDERWA
jgi:hypothetical protein